MFPDDLAHAWRDPRVMHPLLGEETACMARAIPKRRTEFSAGRAAARAALKMPHQAIGVGENRAPVWPAGYCGSISHSNTRCVAVVAPYATHTGVGVDVEPYKPLNPELRESILCACERGASNAEAIQIFSMKEAFYKALAPQLDRILTFQDVHIETCDGHKNAVLRNCAGPFEAGYKARVTCQSVNDHVVSLCVVKQERRL